MEDWKIEKIAKMCHEANRRYCEFHGDKSQVPWGRAEDWQRESAISGARLHITALREDKQPDPRASHQSWMNQKISDGWRYGDKKCGNAKTHPCIVEFDKLDPIQQAKDHIFVEICRTAYFIYDEYDDAI